MQSATFMAALLWFDRGILHGHNDPAIYKVAMEVLRGEHAWLEQGIVSSAAHMEKSKRNPPSSPIGGLPPAHPTPTPSKLKAI